MPGTSDAISPSLPEVTSPPEGTTPPENTILEVAQLLDGEASISLTRILTKKKKNRKKHNKDYERMVRDLNLNNDNDNDNDNDNEQEEACAGTEDKRPTFTFDTAL